VALADIISRIESDAGHEARAIKQDAEEEARRIVAEAETTVARDRESVLAAARRRAENDAATLMANARLRARDAAVGHRSALIEEALGRAEEALATLPEDEYVALVARELVGTARSGDKVLIGADDTGRLSGLPEAVSTVSKDAPVLEFVEEKAPFPHGVLLRGSRTTAEISPASMIRSRRDELVASAAESLFSDGGD
jgi:V/A-type H+-transporting ATPase subunit E